MFIMQPRGVVNRHQLPSIKITIVCPTATLQWLPPQGPVVKVFQCHRKWMVEWMVGKQVLPVCEIIHDGYSICQAALSELH